MLCSAYCLIDPDHTSSRGSDPRSPEDRSRLGRGVWFALGWIAVVLGGIGVVVPGLPTTGFMVFAASCFAKSSPRFERWILELPGVGPHVQAYRDGEGMPRRAKVVALVMMTAAVVFAVGFAVSNIWIRSVIAAAGLVGWWFLLVRVPTSTPKPDDADPA